MGDIGTTDTVSIALLGGEMAVCFSPPQKLQRLDKVLTGRNDRRNDLQQSVNVTSPRFPVAALIRSFCTCITEEPGSPLAA